MISGRKSEKPEKKKTEELKKVQESLEGTEKEIPDLEKRLRELSLAREACTGLQEQQELLLRPGNFFAEEKSGRRAGAEPSTKKQAEEYNKLYTCFLAEQVGLIAGQLKEGEPCPVCGSREHPSPAKAVHQDVTQEKVDAAKEKAERLQEELNASKGRLRGRETAFSGGKCPSEGGECPMVPESCSPGKRKTGQNAGKRSWLLTMRAGLCKKRREELLRKKKRLEGRKRKAEGSGE